MTNKVDEKINEIINEHAAESEKASVSRDVDETARRIKDALGTFSRIDILASDYWSGLYYEAKIMSLREAVLELAKASKPPKPAPVEVETAQVDLEAAIEAAPAPKKGRKAKVALA